jgi:hypothetical protein
MASGKPNMPIRLRPSPQEGKYIRYKISLAGIGLVVISRTLKADRSTVSKVTRGLRRSARIESEIAKILGHSSWNDVVLEARSEIQKKPVEVIVREMKQQQGKNDLAKSIKDNAHDAIFSRDWSAHLKAYAEEQAAAKKAKGKTRRRA